MTALEQAFPTRLLDLGATDDLERAAPPVDPGKINQNIEGDPRRRGVMPADEVAQLLRDPFATQILRRGRFPSNLVAILDDFAAQATSPEGLAQVKTYLVAEGGQIPFRPGIRKGGARLITVLFRRGEPQVLIQTLLPPGTAPDNAAVLNEVIAWDPDNRTLHYYQRQQGAWFWCGQSDMALVAPTRGRGPFDSHVNGYVVMKELKTPWVHWHGPGIRIDEDAFAPGDPFVAHRLFRDRDHALNFETRVVRPLVDRWNQARFDKALVNGSVPDLRALLRQVVESTSANLVSTHAEWAEIDSVDLDDVPPSFFFDMDGLVSELRLPVRVPPLVMSGRRYKALAEKYDLRVRGDGADLPGDVPFCFTVPERALEDVVVLRETMLRGVLSERLAACLLMVDLANPVASPRRAGLLAFVPATATVDAAALDGAVSTAIIAAADAAGPDSPEGEFAANWALGPDAWREAFADRVEAYLQRVAQRLDTEDGCDEIFRLAESRRREFRARPLAEFGLTLPQAVAIPENGPRLVMTEDGAVGPRPA